MSFDCAVPLLLGRHGLLCNLKNLKVCSGIDKLSVYVHGDANRWLVDCLEVKKCNSHNSVFSWKTELLWLHSQYFFFISFCRINISFYRNNFCIITIIYIDKRKAIVILVYRISISIKWNSILKYRMFYSIKRYVISI